MILDINQDNTLELRRVFNPINFVSNDGEKISICMRDSGFEVTYQGQGYSLQKGVVTPDKIETPPLELTFGELVQIEASLLNNPELLAKIRKEAERRERCLQCKKQLQKLDLDLMTSRPIGVCSACFTSNA